MGWIAIVVSFLVLTGPALAAGSDEQCLQMGSWSYVSSLLRQAKSAKSENRHRTDTGTLCLLRY